MKFLLGLLGSTALVAGGTIPIMTINTQTREAIDNGHLLKRVVIKDEDQAKASSSVTTNGKNQAESPYTIMWEAEELGITLEDWFNINWEKSTVLVDGHYSFKNGDDFTNEEEGNLFIRPVSIDMAHFQKTAVENLNADGQTRTISHSAELALDINFEGVTLRARTLTSIDGNDSENQEAQVISTTMVIRTIIFNLYFNK